MTTRATNLYDRRARGLVEATLHLHLSLDRLVEAERQWGPYRQSALARLLQGGYRPQDVPQHWHWDWTRKAAKLNEPGYRVMGVECEQQMQGLVMVAVTGRFAKLPPDAGMALVYVDYLESAPWNVRPFTDDPQFGSVGSRLMLAAVEVSLAEGYSGRVGLHSLPQAAEFYAVTCGMSHLGVDPDYEGLAYFEFNREGAEAFVHRGGAS